VVELGRANGRAKVFREILAYLRGAVSVVDKRAVSSIGKRLGLTPRCVRMHLAALERDSFVLRVHHAGLRFPGQRGWATSAYVVPDALPYISTMPLSRQAKARAELRVPAIAAALLAAGHAQALRRAGAKTPVSPAESTGSRVADNRKTSTEMGEAHPFVQASASSAVSEITTVLPLPPLGSGPVDSARREESGWGGARLRGARTRSSNEGNERQRGLAGLTVRRTVDQLEIIGLSRGEAIQRAMVYSRTAAWRRFRRARGDPEGRQPRWRAHARAVELELERIRREKRAATQASKPLPEP
jgi:hypothetical protein